MMEATDKMKPPEWVQYAAVAAGLFVAWQQSKKKETPVSKFMSPDWLKLIAGILMVGLMMVGGYYGTQARINTALLQSEENEKKISAVDSKADRNNEKVISALDRLNDNVSALRDTSTRLTTIVEERFKERREAETRGVPR